MDAKTRALVIEEINNFTEEEIEEARAFDIVVLYAVLRQYVGEYVTDDAIPVMVMKLVEQRWNDRDGSDSAELRFKATAILFVRWNEAVKQGEKWDVQREIEELLRDL